MSDIRGFKVLSLSATVCVAALVAAACTIHPRGDGNQPGTTTSVDQKAEPMSAELDRCRTISYEQKDELVECRKVWAEKRRQFLGKNSGSTRHSAQPDAEAMAPAATKDQSRLPSGLFPTPMQSER